MSLLCFTSEEVCSVAVTAVNTVIYCDKCNCHGGQYEDHKNIRHMSICTNILLLNLCIIQKKGYFIIYDIQIF